MFKMSKRCFQESEGQDCTRSFNGAFVRPTSVHFSGLLSFNLFFVFCCLLRLLISLSPPPPPPPPRSSLTTSSQTSVHLSSFASAPPLHPSFPRNPLVVSPAIRVVTSAAHARPFPRPQRRFVGSSGVFVTSKHTWGNRNVIVIDYNGLKFISNRNRLLCYFF